MMFNRLFSVIITALFLTSCGGIAPSAPTASSSQATVNLSLPDGVTLSSSGKFSSSSQSIFTASATATVTSIDLAVTATGMTTVTASIPLTAPHQVTLDISAGSARTFTITVATSEGTTFTGSKTVDLSAGSSLSVAIDVTVTSINIAISGTASDTTTTASSLSSSGFTASAGSVGNLAGATVKAIRLDGTLVATTTTDANGAYSLNLPKGFDYIIRITKGNVMIKSLVIASTTDTISDVNPYSSAIVRSLADSIGNADLGEVGTDVTADIDITTLASTITTIRGDANFANLITDIFNDIKNNADYTLPAGTTPTTGGASRRITRKILIKFKRPDGTIVQPTPADTTAPAKPVISTASLTTNNATPTIIGTAEVGSSVALYDAGGVVSIGTATADASGNWSITTTTLSETAHTITAKAKDSAGNVSVASASITVTVDTTSPTITAGSKSPASGTTNVAVDSPISATFSEALKTSTVATSFSLTTTAGAVSGSATTTHAGTIATFTPNAVLANSTLYTALITTGVTDLAGNAIASTTSWSFTTVALPTVTSLYSNGAKWNDYVKNDGTGRACDGTETGGYSACIHGGEKKVVSVTGKTVCTNLTATDALGAFDWTCDASTNPVRMVSRGLKSTKNLSDLLDFPNTGWLANSVTVKDSTTTLFTTASSTTWWGNTVKLAVANASLETSGTTVAGTVYLITSNLSTPYTIGASKVAVVIQPGVTITGSAAVGNETIITANTQNFLWIEGKIDGTGDYYSVNLYGMKFSVLRNISANNTNAVDRFGRSRGTGFSLSGSSNNSLSNITATKSSGTGFSLGTDSNDNSLSNITASNNGANGIVLSTASYRPISNNSLSNITASNNGSNGIILSTASNITLSNITASNNGTSGINLNNSFGNRLINITASNNGQYGVALLTSVGGNFSTQNNSLSNITASNNGQHGVWLNNSTGNSLSNITASNNGQGGVYLQSSSRNYFTGLLKVGNNTTTDCLVSGGGLPGLINTTCANNGTSDATLITGVTVAFSFVAKVTTNDIANQSDGTGGAAAGTATFPASPSTFDWSSFDNSYRSWGLDGTTNGTAFPDASQRGQWTSTSVGIGRIWDWSMKSTDTVIRNVVALNLSGNSVITLGAPTFLRNASEIMGDGIGNDNGLCESNETCLYTPNIGSYQGHGALISAGTFTDGTDITGVTLMKYTTNGY